jgi:putative transposase
MLIFGFLPRREFSVNDVVSKETSLAENKTLPITTNGEEQMHWLVSVLAALFLSRRQLLIEIACLRQQIAVYQRQHPHVALQDRDRRFWILLSRLIPTWRQYLHIVTPQTVLRWHRQGWRAYWRWKSQRQVGRKRIPLALRQLIHRIAIENPLWGQVRIMAELVKLGYLVSPRTVRRYIRRPWPGTPSPHWRTFLTQHAKDMWACDFLTVRTLTFQTLYVFFLIHHASRAIIHARATRHPTAIWTGQQVVNACDGRSAPPYLIRDRDQIYGKEFDRRVESLGIRQIRTPFQAPRANSIAERWIGTLRRECLDYTLILNERHLQNVLDEFVRYYNYHRPHRSLNHHAPHAATIAPSFPPTGPPTILAEPVLSGLHHVYRRAA